MYFGKKMGRNRRSEIVLESIFSGSENVCLRIMPVLLLLFAGMMANAQFGTSPWTAPAGTYTVPNGVTSLTIECRGGGGGGGGAKSTVGGDASAGGGGGGAYSRTTVSVVAGQTCVIVVGSGGTLGAATGANGGAGGTSSVTINSVLSAQAAGGQGGPGSTSGVKAGGAGGSTGTGIVFSGGTGGAGFIGSSFDDGGGGGGGGGSTAIGGYGDTATGDGSTAPAGGLGGVTGGGNGGAGGRMGTNGTDGSAFGGGGGGSSGWSSGSGAGGKGAAGGVIITYGNCAAPTTYNVTGGGSFCTGNAGPVVGLDGSQSGINYQLYLNGTAVGSAIAGTGSAITFGSQNSGGTYKVVTSGYCSVNSMADSAVLMAYSGTPVTPGLIAGPDSICSTSSNQYSVTTDPMATSYTWVLPSGWSGTSVTHTITAVQNTGAGTISVTANNVCGSSTAQTLGITVLSAPATPGSITGPAGVCSGSTDTFSIAGVNGATSYNWTLPNGWSGSSTTSTISAIANATGGNISVTAHNTCGNSGAANLSVTISAVPGTPGTISGPATSCSGSTDTFSITPVSGATLYNWSLPNGWSGSSTDTVISATAGLSGGNITVTAGNNCGNSTAQSLFLVVNSAPATPGIISGNAGICAGASDTFSVAPVTGATSYSWTLPNGWSGASTSETINTSAGPTGAISVVAGNDCGASGAQSLQVTVDPIPVVTFTFPVNLVCINLNPVVALTGATPAGGIYSGSGVTDTVFNASSLSPGYHVITYTYIDSLGCKGVGADSTLVTICSAIESIAAEDVSVFPNPFNNSVSIINSGTYTGMTAVIVDATGRKIYNEVLENGNKVLDTRILKSGVYFLQLINGGKLVSVKKLVKVE